MAINIQGAEIVIEAGFGFGVLEDVTSWTDITADMRYLSWASGRQFELDRVEAGAGSVLLNNRHGNYNPENTAGAFYPDVDIATPIRISAVYDSTTYRLFYGKWEDIPAMFPENVDAVVEVPFSDVFDVLASARTPDVWPQVVTELAPRAFWRMSDLTDSSPEGDHTLVFSVHTAITYDDGAWADDDAIELNGSDQYFTADDGASDLDILGALTIVAWIKPDSGKAQNVIVARDYLAPPYQFWVDTVTDDLKFTHNLDWAVIGSIVSDEWQCVAVVRQSDGVTVTGYVNGVVGQTVTMPSSPATTATETTVGGGTPFGHFDGHISEVAMFDTALSGDDIAALAAIQHEAYPSQRTDERIAALAAAAGITNTDLATGQSTMSASSAPGGSSILEEMGKATDTEIGVLFIAGDGALTFHDRHYRIDNKLTPSASLGVGEDATYQDIAAGRYVANVFNEIAVTPGDAGAPVVVSDATSRQKYGIRTRSVTTYPADAGEAPDHAAYLLHLLKTPGRRVSRISFDMGVDSAAWPIVLGATIGDRFTVHKALAGDDLEQDVYLEAVTHTITSEKTWRVDWDLSPAEFVTGFWVLGSSTRSQLGSTTTLNF